MTPPVVPVIRLASVSPSMMPCADPRVKFFPLRSRVPPINLNTLSTWMSCCNWLPLLLLLMITLWKVVILSPPIADCASVPFPVMITVPEPAEKVPLLTHWVFCKTTLVVSRIFTLPSAILSVFWASIWKKVNSPIKRNVIRCIGYRLLGDHCF